MIRDIAIRRRYEILLLEGDKRCEIKLYNPEEHATLVCDRLLGMEEVILIEDGDVILFEDDVMVIDVVEESSDEDHILSEDSDYESDCSDDFTEISWRILNSAEINTLNDVKNMCCIYFYYQTGRNDKFCTSCFLRLTDMFSRIRAVREHSTDMYSVILGQFCSECGTSLHQITLCNLCPICAR